MVVSRLGVTTSLGLRSMESHTFRGYYFSTQGLVSFFCSGIGWFGFLSGAEMVLISGPKCVPFSGPF